MKIAKKAKVCPKNEPGPDWVSLEKALALIAFGDAELPLGPPLPVDEELTPKVLAAWQLESAASGVPVLHACISLVEGMRKQKIRARGYRVAEGKPISAVLSGASSGDVFEMIPKRIMPTLQGVPTEWLMHSGARGGVLVFETTTETPTYYFAVELRRGDLSCSASLPKSKRPPAQSGGRRVSREVAAAILQLGAMLAAEGVPEEGDGRQAILERQFIDWVVDAGGATSTGRARVHVRRAMKQHRIAIEGDRSTKGNSLGDPSDPTGLL